MTKSSLALLLLVSIFLGGCAASYDGYKYKPYTLRGVRYHPIAPRQAVGHVETGVASHYSEHFLIFPGKTASHYRYVYTDGRHALRAQTKASASLFRKKIRLPALALGEVQFSWKVPALIAIADMALRNFIEMRDLTGRASFKWKKKIEHALNHIGGRRHIRRENIARGVGH